MPKIILRCNYLKNASPSHLANYMNYISTRKGVEKVDSTTALLPATEKQKELIADILSTGMFQGSYADISELDKAVANSGKRCATDKYKEIRTEMRNIYEILEKFERMKGIKTLPLTLDKIELTGDEISKLEAQGYLKISDEKYYLPEIIRLPLGFTYERGARPKVLSLLVQ